MRKLTLAVIVATVFGVGLMSPLARDVSFNTAAKPTQAAMGGINIDAWCKALYMGQARTVLIANNAYGWRCQYLWYGLKLMSIDLNSACKWQYNRSWATAHYRRFSDPYSWYCSY